MLIAEIGLAHMGRMDYAKRLIDNSKDADAVKFQVYKTEELIDEKRDPERYRRFLERELSYSEFEELKNYAEGIGLTWFATPHTVEAFHFLEDLGVGYYKVGSGDRGEIADLCCSTRKQVFISTGMRNNKQIFDLILKYGMNPVYLHCITMYPVSDDLANLGFISTLKKYCRVGYSDHTKGLKACEFAAALGAEVIEKHIMLPESEGQDCSCSVYNFKELRKRVTRARLMCESNYRYYSAEEKLNESWALKKNGKRPYLS